MLHIVLDEHGRRPRGDVALGVDVEVRRCRLEEDVGEPVELAGPSLSPSNIIEREDAPHDLRHHSLDEPVSETPRGADRKYFNPSSRRKKNEHVHPGAEDLVLVLRPRRIDLLRIREHRRLSDVPREHSHRPSVRVTHIHIGVPQAHEERLALLHLEPGLAVSLPHLRVDGCHTEDTRRLGIET